MSESQNELSDSDIRTWSCAYKKATIPELKWWLLYRGIHALSSWKKAVLIEE